ncbi:MAG: DUF6056 family protein [Bacteroidales bacterium]|nr:DUF6056 family protein [Bacteroidales bacterium]MCD8395118.1 DUF6056 family protein [Bacteroidales bacterium]
MNTSRDISRLERFWWLWLLGAVAVYGMMGYLVPWEYDSLNFDYIYRTYNGGSEAFSWDALIQYAQEVIHNDNARLPNLIAPVMSLMVPRWLWGLMAGLAMAVMIGFASMLPRSKRLTSLAFTWLLIVIVLPWSNNLWVGVFAFSYIFPGALMMVIIWLVSKNGAVEPCRTAPPRFILALALALLLGWWHEQFALALACGLIAWVIIGKKRAGNDAAHPRLTVAPSWAILIIVLALIAVAVVAICGSGMTARMAGENGWEKLSAVYVLKRNVPTLALWVVLIAGLFTNGRGWYRQYVASPVLVITSVGALAALVIHLAGGAAARGAFAASLLSVVAWVSLFANPREHRATIWAVVVLVLCIVQGAMADYYQYPYYKQYNYLMGQMRSHPGETIYYDVLPVYTASPWQKGMSSRGTFVEPFTYQCLWQDPVMEGSVVVPTSLDRDLDANPLPSMVRDTVPSEGLYLPFTDRKGKTRYYIINQQSI